METDNIILEHLRAIRAKLDHMDNSLDDLKGQFTSFRLREHANNGENLVRDRRLASVEADIDTIKKRLELID